MAQTDQVKITKIKRELFEHTFQPTSIFHYPFTLIKRKVCILGDLKTRYQFSGLETSYLLTFSLKLPSLSCLQFF